MKNTAPFAALTFAFTVAGIVLGYSLNGAPLHLFFIGAVVACIGASAAAFCMVQS